MTGKKFRSAQNVTDVPFFSDRDRSRRLLGLSQSTYLDKVFKKFKMDQAKKGFLPVLEGVKLSQTRCPTTAEDREKMKGVPYHYKKKTHP